MALTVAYRLVSVDLVVLGAAVEGVSCKTIATYAMRTFELQKHIAASRSEASAETEVIDAEVIEAGLVAQEPLLRHRTQRIMVVCPGHNWVPGVQATDAHLVHQSALQYVAMSVRHFSVVVEWDGDDKVWMTHVPALGRLSSYGDTREATLESTREAITGYLEAAAKDGIPLPRSGHEPSIVELEVSLP